MHVHHRLGACNDLFPIGPRCARWCSAPKQPTEESTIRGSRLDRHSTGSAACPCTRVRRWRPLDARGLFKVKCQRGGHLYGLGRIVVMQSETFLGGKEPRHVGLPADEVHNRAGRVADGDDA
jgi:hypothetical protein